MRMYLRIPCKIMSFAALLLIPFSDIWIERARAQFQNSWKQDIQQVKEKLIVNTSSMSERAMKRSSRMLTFGRSLHMSVKGKTVLFMVTLLMGVTAWAQEFPQHELAAGYSYAYYVPSTSYSKATNQSLNGGGLAYVFNFAPRLGFKTDLQGYESFTNGFTIPVSTNFPAGGQLNVHGDLFTYLFGPQLKLRTHFMQPFGSLLAGGAHSNLYGNAYKQCDVTVDCSFHRAPSGNAFAFAIGGGVDIPVGRHVQIRPVTFDYLLTNFSNPFNHGIQSNWRYAAGLNFTFSAVERTNS